jgi:thiol-disulfide isomerase/thioredoxin
MENETPIVGMMYAKWCPHCNVLEPNWKKMEEEVKDKIEVRSFEESDDRDEFQQFEKKYPVKLQSGYPTLFRIENGNIEYYSGDRDAESLIKWALGKKTGGTRRRRYRPHKSHKKSHAKRHTQKSKHHKSKNKKQK